MDYKRGKGDCTFMGEKELEGSWKGREVKKKKKNIITGRKGKKEEREELFEKRGER